MATAPTIRDTAPATAIAVANEFIATASAEPGVPPVDQMKLQKLLFYAHGWHLGYGHGPLFDSDIEAWPWGPVVREVYLQTKDFGRSPVSGKLYELGRKGGLGAFEVVYPDGVSASIKPFIGSVWNSLKGFSGVQLSNSTHAAGEPWTIIAEKIGTDRKPTIPNDLIAEVFRAKLTRNAAGDTAS